MKFGKTTIRPDDSLELTDDLDDTLDVEVVSILSIDEVDYICVVATDEMDRFLDMEDEGFTVYFLKEDENGILWCVNEDEEFTMAYNAFGDFMMENPNFGNIN